jgi:hypothetical protein
MPKDEGKRQPRGNVGKILVETLLEAILVEVVQYRVYTTDTTCNHLLAWACEAALAQYTAAC